MTPLSHYLTGLDADSAHSVEQALQAYTEHARLDVHLADCPAEQRTLKVSDLREAGYQTPWPSREAYCDERLRYDQETNEWLVHYFDTMAASETLPPVIVVEKPDGVDLVDGKHRVSALLSAGRETLQALVVQP